MDDREADNALIDELVELGVDLSRPREVRFHFVFGIKIGADAVAARLTDDGFTTEIIESKPNLFVRLFRQPQWELSATRVMTVDCFVIAELRGYFAEMMEESHGSYDGWEVEVFPEEQPLLS